MGAILGGGGSVSVGSSGGVSNSVLSDQIAKLEKLLLRAMVRQGDEPPKSVRTSRLFCSSMSVAADCIRSKVCFWHDKKCVGSSCAELQSKQLCRQATLVECHWDYAKKRCIQFE